MNYAPLLNFFLGSYSYICNACKQENLNCNIITRKVWNICRLTFIPELSSRFEFVLWIHFECLVLKKHYRRDSIILLVLLHECSLNQYQQSSREVTLMTYRFDEIILHFVGGFLGVSPWAGFALITLVVIGTDCTSSCKFNYHTITTTTAPILIY
jgi:hypothetical protein